MQSVSGVGEMLHGVEKLTISGNFDIFIRRKPPDATPQPHAYNPTKVRDSSIYPVLRLVQYFSFRKLLAMAPPLVKVQINGAPL